MLKAYSCVFSDYSKFKTHIGAGIRWHVDVDFLNEDIVYAFLFGALRYWIFHLSSDVLCAFFLFSKKSVEKKTLYFCFYKIFCKVSICLIEFMISVVFVKVDIFNIFLEFFFNLN